MEGGIILPETTGQSKDPKEWMYEQVDEQSG